MAEVRPLNEVYTANSRGSNAYRGVGKSNTGYTEPVPSTVRNVAVTRTDGSTSGRRMLNATSGTFETVTDPRNQTKRVSTQSSIPSRRNIRSKKTINVDDNDIPSFTPNSISGRSLQKALGGTDSNSKSPLPGLVGISVLDRARITRISLFNLGWIITVWIAIQVPFALFSIVALGVAAGFDVAKDFIADGGAIVDFLTTPLRVLLEAFTNIDISVEGAINSLGNVGTDIYFVVTILMLGLALLQILILYIQFLLAGFKPVFGTGGGFKFLAICFVCIGFFVPLLNFFPWILLYMVAVWIYPK